MGAIAVLCWQKSWEFALTHRDNSSHTRMGEKKQAQAGRAIGEMDFMFSAQATAVI